MENSNKKASWMKRGFLWGWVLNFLSKFFPSENLSAWICKENNVKNFYFKEDKKINNSLNPKYKTQPIDSSQNNTTLSPNFYKT